MPLHNRSSRPSHGRDSSPEGHNRRGTVTKSPPRVQKVADNTRERTSDVLSHGALLSQKFQSLMEEAKAPNGAPLSTVNGKVASLLSITPVQSTDATQQENIPQIPPLPDGATPQIKAALAWQCMIAAESEIASHPESAKHRLKNAQLIFQDLMSSAEVLSQPDFSDKIRQALAKCSTSLSHVTSYATQHAASRTQKSPQAIDDALAAKNYQLTDTDIQLQKLVGKGASGYVFEGYQKSLKRKVAVKITQGADDLIHEAEKLAQIEHSAVLPIYAVTKDTLGNTAIVMPLIEGGADLMKHMKENGPLSLPDFLNLSLQITDGLRAVHDADIIHRDVKPHNVMVTQSSEKLKVRLSDFGLATSEKTQEKGTIHGTPAFMSKRAFAASITGDLSPDVDVYSLGSTLYCLYTRQLPFTPLKHRYGLSEEGLNPTTIGVTLLSHKDPGSLIDSSDLDPGLVTLKNSLKDEKDKLGLKAFDRIVKLLERMTEQDPKDPISLDEVHEELTAISNLEIEEERKAHKVSSRQRSQELGRVRAKSKSNFTKYVMAAVAAAGISAVSALTIVAQNKEKAEIAKKKEAAEQLTKQISEQSTAIESKREFLRNMASKPDEALTYDWKRVESELKNYESDLRKLLSHPQLSSSQKSILQQIIFEVSGFIRHTRGMLGLQSVLADSGNLQVSELSEMDIVEVNGLSYNTPKFAEAMFRKFIESGNQLLPGSEALLKSLLSDLRLNTSRALNVDANVRTIFKSGDAELIDRIDTYRKFSMSQVDQKKLPESFQIWRYFVKFIASRMIDPNGTFEQWCAVSDQRMKLKE